MPLNSNARLSQAPDWCDIAERAAKESDPKKLIQLVRALCDRLQEAERMKKKGSQPSPPSESFWSKVVLTPSHRGTCRPRRAGERRGQSEGKG